MDIYDDDFCYIYNDIIYELLDRGQLVGSGKSATVEIPHLSFYLSNPRKRNPPFLRHFSYPFAIGEFCWYMSGSDSLSFMEYYAPSYKKYSDDGKTLHGAYGKRSLRAMNLVDIYYMLRDNPNTRRAVLSMYNSNEDLIESKDIPCTTSIQFLLRDNSLDLVVNMRSNDAYYGLPYDVHSFTLIQQVMAEALGVELGNYFHYATSMHLYIRDSKKAKKIVERFIDNSKRRVLEDKKEDPIINADKNDNFGVFNRVLDLRNAEKVLRDNFAKSIVYQNKFFMPNTLFSKYITILQDYADIKHGRINKD